MLRRNTYIFPLPSFIINIFFRQTRKYTGELVRKRYYLDLETVLSQGPDYGIFIFFFASAPLTISTYLIIFSVSLLWSREIVIYCIFTRFTQAYRHMHNTGV